jgi:hypothetical protein
LEYAANISKTLIELLKEYLHDIVRVVFARMPDLSRNVYV